MKDYRDIPVTIEDRDMFARIPDTCPVLKCKKETLTGAKIKFGENSCIIKCDCGYNYLMSYVEVDAHFKRPFMLPLNKIYQSANYFIEWEKRMHQYYQDLMKELYMESHLYE